MSNISGHFYLGKTQSELDFLNVKLSEDNRLFVDPFAISQRVDPFSQTCHRTLCEFFTRVIEAIRCHRDEQALELLSFLREPNETRLGFSRGRPQGAGIGVDQSREIFNALKVSSAVRTGFISSLEECEIMIPGISRDKISDLTTNVIRGPLAEYTRRQCELLNIPTREAPLPPTFVVERNRWESQYYQLPVVAGRPLLFVPKVFARYDPGYNHQKYYRHFVLDYLKAEHLSAQTSLVRTLKSGRQVVHKKDLEAIFPCTKENLFAFSREHPEVLMKYRSSLAEMEKRGVAGVVSVEEEQILAEALSEALRAIPPGSDAASTYHSLVVGLLEFLFFPHLLNPVKEREIHEGRKRIDIVMENGARSGIFSRLHQIRNIPCTFIPFECKNYGRDIANPELDQLAGRFAPRRGRVGFLCCRSLQNQPLFVERCRDTFRDDRGLVIPIDDDFFIEALSYIRDRQRDLVDGLITTAVNEISFS